MYDFRAIERLQLKFNAIGVDHVRVSSVGPQKYEVKAAFHSTSGAVNVVTQHTGPDPLAAMRDCYTDMVAQLIAAEVLPADFDLEKDC